MPLPDGSLSEEEMAVVLNKLSSFWEENGGRDPCRSCGSHLYYIHPALLGNRSDTLIPISEHTRQPTVMVYCQKCGLADHYVAAVLGVKPLNVAEQ